MIFDLKIIVHIWLLLAFIGDFFSGSFFLFWMQIFLVVLLIFNWMFEYSDRPILTYLSNFFQVSWFRLNRYLEGTLCVYLTIWLCICISKAKHYSKNYRVYNYLYWFSKQFLKQKELRRIFLFVWIVSINWIQNQKWYFSKNNGESCYTRRIFFWTSLNVGRKETFSNANQLKNDNNIKLWFENLLSISNSKKKFKQS